MMAECSRSGKHLSCRNEKVGKKIERDRFVEEPNKSYTSSTFRFLLTLHAIIDFLLLRLDPAFPLSCFFFGSSLHPAFVTVSLACNTTSIILTFYRVSFLRAKLLQRDWLLFIYNFEARFDLKKKREGIIKYDCLC